MVSDARINGLPLSANDVGFSPLHLSPAIMLLVYESETRL